MRWYSVLRITYNVDSGKKEEKAQTLNSKCSKQKL